MYGQFDLITLIAIVVAVAAIIKLGSVLGRRTDECKQRIKRLKTREREVPRRAAAETASTDVVTMPRRDHESVPSALTTEVDGQSVEAQIRAYPVQNPAVTAGLLDIAKLDPSLDPNSFLVGAGRAHEMIVSAFAEGNHRTLKDLLSKEVYDVFTAVIAEREARGEAVEQQFVGIKKAEIVEAEVKNGIASVTVLFISEIISVTHDRTGQVIAGDSQKIKDVTGIWTFSRNISTAKARSNPNWSLVATQATN